MIRRFISEMNPFLRGMLIVALVALIVVVLELYQTLTIVSGLLRIAFFLAVALFLFLWWRSRRADIDTWSGRSRAVFYGGAILIVLDLALVFSPLRTEPLAGFTALSFVLVLILSAFAMLRVWRDEHRLGS